jgi:hypothetical protein
MNKLIVLFLMLLGLIALLWYCFFFDDVVVSGTKYGFSIGMTQKDAIEVIGRDYKGKDVQIVLSPKVAKTKSSEIEYLDVKQLDSDSVKNMEIWELRFRKSESNVLMLRFSNDDLVEMTRYRRAFIP